ncbi:MAG: mechanosensitive ion channel domain-containing protein [Myxococcota bacterium]
MSAPTTFGDAVVLEIATIPQVFGVRLLLWVGVVWALAIVLRAAATGSVKLAWRLGVDRARRLGRVAAITRAVIWIVAVLAIARPVFIKLPVLTTVTVAVVALLASIALPGLVQSVAAGLSLALRARYREGDQIEIGGFRGSIRALGLVRTQLRVEDGSAVWIPNSMLDREAVKVDRSTGAAPVRVRFEIDPAQRDRALDAVARAVMMLPFRRSGSQPRLIAASDDEREWTVELQTWATRELDVVRRSLRRTVDGVVDKLGGAG